MTDSTFWSLPASLSLFILATLLILVFGVMMTHVAADLAQRTGLGETLMGALLLGVTTSLPEIATSLTAALDSQPDLAFSNAVGSVAGQTAFLALADMAYRRANLEHAAASAENLLLSAFLIVMLSIPLLGIAMPQVEVWNIHPVTLLLFVAYLQGMRMVSQVHEQPMWIPINTRETRHAASDSVNEGETSSVILWSRFAIAALMTALAGWLLARSAVPLSVHTGLSQTLMGGVFTGLAGSLPEFVTALAAVRLGALSLAVGDILGGNCFDVLIVGLTDVAYPGGSVYRHVGQHQDFLLALTLLLSATLLMGLLFREKHGVGNIGLESFLLLVFYLSGIGLLVSLG